MRATFSSVAVVASSLLVREVFAVPHMHRHKRAVVTDVVMVTEEITVTKEADGNYETGQPVIIGTTTIDGSPIVVTSTPAATPSSPGTPATTPVQPASSSSTSSQSPAILIQKPSETQSTSTPADLKTSSSTTLKTSASSSSTSTSSSASSTSSSSHSSSSTLSSTPAASSSSSSYSSSSSTSSSAASTSSSSSSGKKRGLAYNDASLLAGFGSSKEVSWAYNWASSTSDIPSGIEFVPILWGASDSFTSNWIENANAALKAGTTHLMSFNEPDYSGEANLGVQDAVKDYLKWMQPYATKAKIGTPAVTNGVAAANGDPMGLNYLTQFVGNLTQQGGSYDFCAVHWYAGATDISYFKTFMQGASTACNGKPVWLTEFQGSGSASDQQTFLETVMPWMDQQSFVERYSYFMVATGNLISTGTTLSALGNIFASFT